MNGMRVRDIQFRGASILDPDRLRDLLVQKDNEPLDKNKLRRSIQALYATGRFSDIQVEAERYPPNDLTLVFVAKENYFVGPVTLTGAPKHGPSDYQLINAAKLELGELFTEQKLRDGIESMKRALEEGGYYQATVTPTLKTNPTTQQVDIHFDLQAGEQARIGKILVTGGPGYSVEEIIDITDLGPGKEVRQERLARGLQKLRNKYQKDNRLEAEIAITERRYNPDSNTVDYSFNIVRGPTVDIQLRGAKLRKGLIKKYVPVYEENAVDDDLLNEGRRNLRDYFQTKGYFDVSLDFRQEEEPGAEHRYVVYIIERGERHKLGEVAIEGNDYFDEELIRNRLLIQPAGPLLSHGLYSQSMLSRDVESIEDLYQSNGFQQVQVKAEVQDDYQGKKGRMRVLFHIEEGPQTRVASLKIEGNESVSESEIRDLLATIENQPFSNFSLATDRDNVVNFYFNRGFPEVRFEWATQPVAGDPTRMNVTYKITEGRRLFVDRVLISGLDFTQPFVVDRELLIRDGQPLSQADMFDSQRRLYDLGIFSEAGVAVQNPEGQARHKNVLFDLTEARRYTFTYGLGLEVQTGSEPGTTQPQGRTGFSPRVSFDVTRINFRGKDHTIAFKSRLGRLQQRALVSYEAPRWFNKQNLKLTFTGFFDTTRDVRTFTAQRLEGSVQAEQTWSKATTLLYRFSYRRVKVTELVVEEDQLPLLSRPVRVGMPSFNYIRDTRDDPLDSRKGMYTILDTGVSSRIFGSQASFARFLAQNSTYHPFQFQRTKLVLARSTRLGIEHPFGANPLIPLPERFFAGGGNSHRGFAINQAGPRDFSTGFPLGGEAMFLNNVELRLPPFALPFVGESISAVLFHDMGNVFSSTTDMFRSLFRTSQRFESTCASTDPAVNSACDFNYMSHAVGGGIRYRTPIGPVRVDFGYNLNPPTFPVNRDGRTETLGRFNFFFSIGQTF